VYFASIVDSGGPSSVVNVVDFFLDVHEPTRTENLQSAVFRFAAEYGAADFELEYERIGSIRRFFRGKVDDAKDSPALRQKIAEANAAISLALVGKAQAEVDCANADGASTLLEQIKGYDNACVDVAGNLIVKITAPDGTTSLLARRLSTIERVALERHPGILDNPSDAFRLLAAAVTLLAEGADNAKALPSADD
jgi:hypothetical protein